MSTEVKITCDQLKCYLKHLGETTKGKKEELIEAVKSKGHTLEQAKEYADRHMVKKQKAPKTSNSESKAAADAALNSAKVAVKPSADKKKASKKGESEEKPKRPAFAKTIVESLSMAGIVFTEDMDIVSTFYDQVANQVKNITLLPNMTFSDIETYVDKKMTAKNLFEYKNRVDSKLNAPFEEFCVDYACQALFMDGTFKKTLISKLKKDTGVSKSSGGKKSASSMEPKLDDTYEVGAVSHDEVFEAEESFLDDGEELPAEDNSLDDLL